MFMKLFTLFVLILCCGFVFSADVPLMTFLANLNDGVFSVDEFSVDEDVVVSANLFYFAMNGTLCNLSGGYVTANLSDNIRDSVTGSDGVATFNFGRLEAGQYLLIFSYAGNDTYQGINSESVNISVVPADNGNNNGTGDGGGSIDDDGNGRLNNSDDISGFGGLLGTGFPLIVFLIVLSVFGLFYFKRN